MTDERQAITGERNAQLDRLRGIAILGILFMNIPYVAGSVTAIFSDRPDLLGWTEADRIAFFLQSVLAEGTARGMLELLFGAGMVILTTRLAVTMSAGQAFRAYYRRYIILLLFGVAHIFVFLWVGDILSIYAPAALALFFFRNLSARTLLIAGLLLGPVFSIGGQYVEQAPERARPALIAGAEAAAQAGRAPTEAQREAVAARDQERAAARSLPARIAQEREARLGGLMGYVRWAHDEAITFITSIIRLFMTIEALATMLIGAALFKWGVLQGERSTGFYWAMLAAGYGVGLAVRVPDILAVMAIGAGRPLDFAYEAGRLPMTLGHLALLALVAKTVAGGRLLSPFGKAGRVALSLYLFQSIVCGWVLFPGIGLGLWGRLGWAGMMGVVVGLSLLQLLIAELYLRRYATGPVEWLWRRLAGTGPQTRAPDGAGPVPA